MLVVGRLMFVVGCLLLVARVRGLLFVACCVIDDVVSLVGYF